MKLAENMHLFKKKGMNNPTDVSEIHSHVSVSMNQMILEWQHWVVLPITVNGKVRSEKPYG